MATSKEVIRCQRRKKMTAIEHFGGKCQLCGYDKCQSALEFHHLDRSKKRQSPSYVIMRWAWADALIELEKCVLVCSNCHKEIHYGMHCAEDITKVVLPTIEKTCTRCGKVYKTKRNTQLHCSSTCAFISSRKVERPSKEELFEDMANMTWLAIGRKYGVSDNAVRKWAKQFGLLA